MMAPESSDGYIELAPSQLLDDKWRELNFDLASGPNVLQDLVVPESGGGYVYRDARQIGSPTHNRFIYWRTVDDTLELVEVSSEVVLDGAQVRIRFANSSILNNITVIEYSNSIVLMVATSNSVHRFPLPHPRTTDKSVLEELSYETLFNPANYHILHNNQGSLNSQQPLCAASWSDGRTLKCALGLPDSTIHIVQISRNSHHISTSEIKQIGIIGRIWSRMPNLIAKNSNECDNAVVICVPSVQPDDVLLFTLCRDWKIRVFSTKSQECLFTHNVIEQHNPCPTAEQPTMKMVGPNLVVYLPEGEPKFAILSYAYEDGIHTLEQKSIIQTPSWEKLVDFSLTDRRIWALANVGDTGSSLFYLDIDEDLNEPEQAVREFVKLSDGVGMPRVENYVAEIFWSNRFSISTVQKALVGLTGQAIPKGNTMKSLEEIAFTRIVDEDQGKAWRKFYFYCFQNHQSANKNLGLVVSRDESIVSLIKRSNYSIVCPWFPNDDSGVELTESLKRDLNEVGALDDRLNPSDDQFAYPELLPRPELLACLDKLTRPNLQAINRICDRINLSGSEITQVNLRSQHKPLRSNFGVGLTFESFNRVARARARLCRHLLIYLRLLLKKSGNDKAEEFYVTMKRISDCLRSYAVLAWIAETPIKAPVPQTNREVVNFIASKFKFFKSAPDASNKIQESSVESFLSLNLLTNFLVNGGINFSSLSGHTQTLSDCSYVTDVTLNLCRLLWPMKEEMCMAEFLFTQELDEHLDRYLELTNDWISVGQSDRYFLQASNCLLQNRSSQAVNIFNRLWVEIDSKNIIGRFIDLEASEGRTVVTKPFIHRYYLKLIQLFEIRKDYDSLVNLINHCITLLDGDADDDQKRWLDCFRAQLSSYYRELNEPDEAYNMMVLITDSSLRFNCLRSFIVYHCEREQWSRLLSYPFIDTKTEFIDILNEKANSSDLSKLNETNFYKTSFYDLLFASYVSDEDYRSAAQVMYNYAQRLAHEVPEIISIKKQADCLLISLNALRCVPDGDNFIESGAAYPKEEGRSLVSKRKACDSESDISIEVKLSNGDATESKVYCIDIEMRYELTRARLKLLERDPKANDIAKLPMKAEDAISQLVASSMFSIAIDLAQLFKAPMDQILEGLTAKYIFIMRLSPVNIAMHQDLERNLSDIFTSSYAIIDTYNYIANSSSPYADKLWRLIEYYLVKYDGISHRYRTKTFADTFGGTTVLMRIVATKLLSAGCDVPASLKRMYMTRNPSELLKLLIKFDKLVDAAGFADEMIEKTLEPTNYYTVSSPPLYLPTHLIILLISYLNEDATNTCHIATANALTDKLDRFRRFVAAV